jgi:hypothetical protein
MPGDSCPRGAQDGTEQQSTIPRPLSLFGPQDRESCGCRWGIGRTRNEQVIPHCLLTDLLTSGVDRRRQAGSGEPDSTFSEGCKLAAWTRMDG